MYRTDPVTNIYMTHLWCANLHSAPLCYRLIRDQYGVFLCCIVLLSFAVWYATKTTGKPSAWLTGQLADLERKSKPAETTMEQVKRHLLTSQSASYKRNPLVQQLL